jgi:GTP-binding protein
MKRAGNNPSPNPSPRGGGERTLFRHPWRLVTEAPTLAALPAEGPPEVAFAGRSNVGKSSLINAVTKTSNLARTSNTPGRTQSLFFFVPDPPDPKPGALPPVAIVDLPGYGFAKAPKTTVKAWTKLLRAYLAGRAPLKRVFLLVDARHGLKPVDSELMDELDRAGVSYQIVLTKADKVKEDELAAIEKATAEATAKRPAAHPTIVVSSSLKGEGIEALRNEIAAFSRRP